MYNRPEMKWQHPILLILLFLGLVSCMPSVSGASPQADIKDTATIAPTQGSSTEIPSTLALPAPTRTLPASEDRPTASITPATGTISTPTSTNLPPLGPDEWQSLPAIPEVSPTVRGIYAHGLLLGNNPNAFSKVGDCGSTPAWFLGDFDRGPRFYSLGEHTDLEGVIQAFQGSYGRTSLAAKSGFNASSVFSLLWADRTQCNANETPLACEYRVHKPAFAFITLGSNDVYHQDTFEKQMRAIIEFSIEQGVVPIVSTKADNLEGDGSLNATIAQLAREYDVPLWNYWLSVQQLPDFGLQDDQVHLTWGPNRFDDPQAMKSAWATRNLTALQTLDAVWRLLSQ